VSSTLFKSCDAIVTCDDQGTVHRSADLLVEGCAISRIAKHIPEAELPTDTEVIDATGHFVYPGLKHAPSFLSVLCTKSRPS